MVEEMKNKILAHLINIVSGKLIAQKTIFYVPRVGDEIRLSEKEFYLVVKVVWCYDEDSVFSRVNIGIKKIK